MIGVLVGVTVNIVVTFELSNGLNIGVVVAVDVANGGLVVFVTPLVYPATNTLSNTMVIMNTTKIHFFIFIHSFGENFPVIRDHP